MTTTSSNLAGDAIRRVLEFIAQDSGILATLRRNVGRSLEESPDSWPYVLEVTGQARWREPAAHLVLGLFALHHQSKIAGSLDREDCSLGKAVRELKTSRGKGGASEQGVERRFRAVLASDSVDALGVHLRGLVTLMRAAEVPLDYPQLYLDLSRWLSSLDRRQSVCLRWARDYYAVESEQQEMKDNKG